LASVARPSSLIHTPQRHVEEVYAAAHADMPLPGAEEVLASWQRSALEHGVDPAQDRAPRVLSFTELRDLREPIDALICSAQDELDRLYGLVRDAGYTILFCDTAGVAVEHRGDERDASRFRYWGTWLGGVWSEAIEGTNGIGTCIAEERPVTIHRGQHFRSRHIDLSCSGAPIFGPDGRLFAVLDVSAIDPQLSEKAHALTGSLTTTAARNIEERFFRECFRRHWIIMLAGPGETRHHPLLAVDGDQRIVGANRAARATLGLGRQALPDGFGVWAIFERMPGVFRRNNQGDIATPLTIKDGSEVWPALVTPPESGLAARQSPAGAALHTRARQDLLGTLARASLVAPQRGGLPPGAERRVRDYVDAHLGDSIDLAELAAIAGLSLFHFARQFKQSVGVTPHQYLVQRRVEHAQKILARTDLSLSAVAVAAGFADQSHLARHFRQLLGATPREFRLSQR
jgi:transcriptional regulator of acetoin/glycerol metabolism/AraC-like DNA-binding protein